MSLIKLIIAFLLCWSIEMAPASITINSFRFGSPALICSEFQTTSTTFGDFGYISGATKHSQRIKNPTNSTATVCQVLLRSQNVSGSATVKVGFFSSQNGGGTQYGSWSDPTPVTDGSTLVTTWSTSPELPGTEFYVAWQMTASDMFDNKASTSGYGDSTFDLWIDGAQSAAGQMWCLTVDVLQ